MGCRRFTRRPLRTALCLKRLFHDSIRKPGHGNPLGFGLESRAERQSRAIAAENTISAYSFDFPPNGSRCLNNWLYGLIDFQCRRSSLCDCFEELFCVVVLFLFSFLRSCHCECFFICFARGRLVEHVLAIRVAQGRDGLLFATHKRKKPPAVCPHGGFGVTGKVWRGRLLGSGHGNVVHSVLHSSASFELVRVLRVTPTGCGRSTK